MNNKRQIEKLRDNAELAMAAYGYFDLMGQRFDKKILKDIDRESTPIITQTDILDSVYNGYIAMGKNRWGQDIELGTLKGDFTPTQAKNFFDRYDLLEHCPNTDSGFSATLFKDTKADSKDSEYILSIRGTEFKLEQIQDLLNDYYIGTNNSDMNRVIEQYFDMLLFYEETLKPLLREKGIARINVIGHSLGGYLAQLFALSYPHSINEVYTYNAPLESMSLA